MKRYAVGPHLAGYVLAGKRYCVAHALLRLTFTRLGVSNEVVESVYEGTAFSCAVCAKDEPTHRARPARTAESVEQTPGGRK